MRLVTVEIDEHSLEQLLNGHVIIIKAEEDSHNELVQVTIKIPSLIISPDDHYYKSYTCTDCNKISRKRTNFSKIDAVGYCNYCEHPLWN